MRRSIRFWTLSFVSLYGSLIFAGCASFRTTSEIAIERESRESSQIEPLKITQLGNDNGPSDQAGPTEPLTEVKEKRLKIQVELNDHVQKWITFFIERDKDRFQRFLDRGQPYRDVVENTLEENDLPAELYYLAMIESGFQTNALSSARAVGVWQFMASTARRYGLRVDRYVDERMDPIRSTEAAAKYLRDLYNVFGSWHLAMAAYNAGEMRILQAIFRGRTRNFWELIRTKSLPPETADYIPKFLAVTLIGQNPEKFGLRAPRENETYPDLESVAVPKGLSLNKLAASSGLDLNLLKKVNPHLRNGRIPPTPVAYEVWIPRSMAASVKKENRRDSAILPAQERNFSSVRFSEEGKLHIVQQGDTLIEIARKYKLSLGHLMRINDLKTTRIFKGMALRTQMKTYQSSRLVRYKVKRGDNLSIIASKFKTSVSKIRSSNRLRKNFIYAGQVLKVELDAL